MLAWATGQTKVNHKRGTCSRTPSSSPMLPALPSCQTAVDTTPAQGLYTVSAQ